MKWTPYDYQQRALELCLERGRVQALMEMGLGKTVIAATTFAEWQDRLQAHRCLVVSTVRIVHQTWPDELSKWDHLQGIHHRIICGTPVQRKAILAKPYGVDLHLINYELLPWLVEQYQGRWDQLPWDVVIFDESSKLKSHTSKRFRAARELATRVPKVLNLSGSLVPNSLLDVWAPQYLIDQGAALGQRYWDYRARNFSSDFNGWKWTPKKGAVQRIKDALEPSVFVMRALDYLDMPELVVRSIDPQLPSELRDMYERFEAEMVMRLKTEEVVAANAAVLLGKLLQLSNGALYTCEGRQWEEVHEHKLDMLEEVVEEANGEPVLVAYTFRHDVPRIQKRFGKKVQLLDKTGAILPKWNAGEVPILLGHPETMALGLNLQHGGRILAWFGLPWSHQLYEQTNARLWRQGQEKPVFVYHLMFRDAVEVRVREALIEKRRVQDVLMDALRLEKVAP